MAEYHIISCTFTEKEAKERLKELNEKDPGEFMLMTVEFEDEVTG